MNQRQARLLLCGLLIALGISVLAGWIFRIEALKSLVPGLSTMKFNTALCFVLVGIGLAAAGFRRASALNAAMVAGAMTAAVGAVTLAEYAGLHVGLVLLFLVGMTAFNSAFVFALFVPAMSFVLASVILAVARRAHWRTRARRQRGSTAARVRRAARVERNTRAAGRGPHARARAKRWISYGRARKCAS